MTAFLPAETPITAALLRESNGGHVPSEMKADGRIAFRVKALPAGGEASYFAEEGESAARAQKGGAAAVQDREAVKLTIDGKPILAYQTSREPKRKEIPSEYWRSGYLHPVYSPAGVVVTDDYPKDKLYQHGIWSGWQKVDFGYSHPDFWDASRRKGRISMESVGPLWGGPVATGFEARQYLTDMDARVGSTVLREAWSVTAFREASRVPYFVVDLESRQDPMNGLVVLGESSLGGITIRGNRDWQGASKSIFLSSEGTERSQAQGAPARWCYLGGKSGGKQAGVAILAHPQNPKAPEAVFIDPEEPVMGFAPTKNGAISLKPGAALYLRYRFVVLDGKPDSKLFDRLWNDFANPPVVRVRGLGEK